MLNTKINNIEVYFGNLLTNKFTSFKNDMNQSVDNMAQHCKESRTLLQDDILSKIEASVKENEAIRMQWKEHMDRLKENLRVMNGINGETEDEVLENNSTFDSVHDRSTISNVALTERIEKLEEEIKGLQEKNFKLDCRVIECEQYSRRENLVISGIPENIKDTELEKTVISTLEKLSIYVNGKDISACHRLGRYNRNSRYPRRVIVRFVNRKIGSLSL